MNTKIWNEHIMVVSKTASSKLKYHSQNKESNLFTRENTIIHLSRTYSLMKTHKLEQTTGKTIKTYTGLKLCEIVKLPIFFSGQISSYLLWLKDWHRSTQSEG